MKTILEPSENVIKLWGKQRVKDQVTYRLLKYLIRCEVEEGILLHNVVTRQLILLSKEEESLLQDLPAKPTEPMRELIETHFLVPEDFDEYRSVNQLRRIYQSRSVGGVINHYVILPTTFCNARCFYCYESDYPRIHMTEETAEKLIQYIADHRDDKKVKLSWFGGEPLVGVKRIDQISQGLKDRGIPYRASMISNAYLFDEDMVERAKSLWNLEYVQVTLDGTEDVYNQAKAYVNVSGSPFKRVLKNIDLLTAKDIRVHIRLNVGFYNKDNIMKLIEKLGEWYSGKPYISVYLNILFNDEGFEPVHHTIDDIIRLSRIIDDYAERLKELQLGGNNLELPQLKFSQCMADNPRAVLIQPDGSFCRCEHENIRDAYGNLDEGVLIPQKVLEWRETIERSDHCPECIIYPACYLLKGCMNANSPCIEEFRIKSQQKCEEMIRSVYHQNQEGGNNEKVCSS